MFSSEIATICWDCTTHLDGFGGLSDDSAIWLPIGLDSREHLAGGVLALAAARLVVLARRPPHRGLLLCAAGFESVMRLTRRGMGRPI